MDDSTPDGLEHRLDHELLERPANLTNLDLSTIVLALETHERVHIERAKGNPDAPAAIAARRTLAKVRRLLKASRTK